MSPSSGAEFEKLAPVGGRYVQVDSMEWAPFPEALCDGPIRWKLLNVSPEMGAWTAIFDCPAGSSFARHVHIGPGEYLFIRGKMEVRGGEEVGGSTAQGLAYGYEACNARHDQTYFPEDSEFYMTFLGPLNFIDEEGNTLALVTWKDVQEAWNSSQAS